MKKTTLLATLEFLLMIVFLGAFYFRDLHLVEFHIDESHWIGTSYMFEAYFKGEFWSDAWDESQPTLTNPPVPRYVIGISRFVGGYRIPDLNRRWDYEHNRNFNLRRGAMPSNGLLWWSRLPMALLGVFSLAMGFFLLCKVGGRLPAYLWVIFGVANPFMLLQTRRAMAEASILFFVMLAALCCYGAIRTLRQPPEKAPWLPYLLLGLCGVCIGLAGESKINGLSVLVGVVASIAAFVLWQQKDAPTSKAGKARRILGLSALVSVVTVVVFLGSYPYLWPNLLGRTLKIAQNRVEEMRYQSTQHPSDAIETLEQRLTIIPRRIFQDYAVFHFDGTRVLNVALTVLGAGLTAWKVRAWAIGRDDDPAALVLLTFALTASVPAFLTLLDWDRYYLFPVFFSTGFIMLAIGWLVKQARRWTLDRGKTVYRPK